MLQSPLTRSLWLSAGAGECWTCPRRQPIEEVCKGARKRAPFTACSVTLNSVESLHLETHRVLNWATYIPLGLPSFLVLVAMLQNHASFDKTDKKIERALSSRG